MYQIELNRKYRKATYTIGELYLPDSRVKFCDTLEDRDRDLNRNGIFDCGEVKIPGETAIPNGRYKIIFNYSSTMSYKYDGKFLPLLLNVPNFSGVRIHAGNTNKDTRGCILVGENKQIGKVINSKAVFWKLYPILWNKKDDLWIKIY